MAQNLAGMFAQLNNAIQQNPMAEGGVGNRLIDGMSMNAGNLMGQGVNYINKDKPPVNPMQYMNEGGQALAAKQQLGKLDFDTSEGLIKAASIYQQMGDVEKAASLAKMGNDKALAEAEAVKLGKLRETLQGKALKFGLPDYAKDIATGGTDLKEDAKKLQELEMQRMIEKGGLPARKAYAKTAGINDEMFTALGLDKLTDDQFKDHMNGRDADTKGYQLKDGTNSMYQTNKFGQVKVPGSVPPKWVSPSDLGIVGESPQISKVHNVSNMMVEKLAIGGVENFQELHVAAQDAVVTMENIDRNLALIDDMPTGMFADAKVQAMRLAQVLGMDTGPAVANAEVFRAEAAQRVAKEIKAFGSGTGLSDKDREFTEDMVAGKISLNAESIRRILRIRRDVSADIVGKFDKTKAAVSQRIGDPGIMDMYTVDMPKPQGPTPTGRTADNPTTGERVQEMSDGTWAPL